MYAIRTTSALRARLNTLRNLANQHSIETLTIWEREEIEEIHAELAERAERVMRDAVLLGASGRWTS